ncbi:MAG: formate--tetrahydrofolate ligase [Verrucomicrobiota bacterium]
MNDMSIREIQDVANDLEIPEENLECYGNDRAKIDLDFVTARPVRGKFILVSAITPTPAGEGKTTTSIALAQGMRHRGQNVALALREPSMGPVFGRKGGATGGGLASLTPSEKINLHFNGDFHAITTAHNLIASTLDNQLHFRSTPLDPRRVLWKRALDANDRSLREVNLGLGGHGVPRESGFDITAASEVMAIFCLSESMEDLRDRLDRILLGYDSAWNPVFASSLNITGALLAVLRDAMRPNLVQSLEGVPAVIHGGPFANIAHGCNSVLATRTALGGADYTITEAGFAFDLGGEKFFDIKCRSAGIAPDAVVLVATIRALKMHGGVSLANLTDSDPEAVDRGLENLAAHLEAAAKFRRPIVVAINAFPDDTDEEFERVRSFCVEQSIPCVVSKGFVDGGPGSAELADVVVEAASKPSPPLKPLYSLEAGVSEKIETIAREVYGADGVHFAPAAEKKLARFEKLGLTKLPVCMAKTQNSISDNPALLGRPKNFKITVRDFEIANGAGFLVALTGDILRMPALPKVPAAEGIDIDADGNITGLMAG